MVARQVVPLKARVRFPSVTPKSPICGPVAQPVDAPASKAEECRFESYLAQPEEARTPRKDRCAKDHRAPSHISKMVPPTIPLGPPSYTRSRTFGLRFSLAL